MKKGKIDNPTKNRRDSTKVVDLYTDLFTFREMPASEALIERVLEESYKLAISDPEYTSIIKIFRKVGVSHETAKRWSKKYEWAGHLYSLILQAVGDNRQEGGLRGKFNSAIVVMSQPIYDNDWRDIVEWRAKLKADSTGTGNVTVVMPAIEKSDMVPDRESE